MDSFESRMNPRFLAESEKGMLWEPRVIESRRGTVEGFKEDEKGKRRASVLWVVIAMISERDGVYRTKIMGPSTGPWGTPYMSCDGDEDELLNEVDWYLSEKYEWNHWSAVDWMPKTEFRRERRIWWSIVSKAAERSNKRRTEMLSLSRAERISFTIRNKTVSVLCPAR